MSDQERNAVPVLVADAEVSAYVASLEARLNKAEQALQYIERPTMGLPGGADAEAFVDEATEANVRLALKTCIRTARAARASIRDTP